MVLVNTKNGRKVTYRTLVLLAIISGGAGIALQFVPDGENLAFMLSVAGIGGLSGGRSNYNEREFQQLRQSYKIAYEWLLLTVMTAYAIILISRWLGSLDGAAIFLNSNWPGLVIALMCFLMG